MKKTKWCLLLIMWTIFSISGLGQEDVLTPKKKLIELGWDSPSTGYLKDHWKEMEEQSPFDGVIFHLSPKGKISSLALMDAQPWVKEDYAVCIDDLKKCEFKQFTDNFVNIFFTPGTIKWNDDEAWKAITNKAGICAWVSREGGCRGISLDFESYGKPLFMYNPEDGISWEEAKRLAVRRGSEFVQAIATIKPDAVLLCLWMNSVNFKEGQQENPDRLLKGNHYGLLPSFINGMLSAAPPEMILVDGCENGYYYNSKEEYQQAALDMVLWTGPAMKLVAPELKQKYRNQVRAGFGFYLDMFSNPEGSVFYRGPKEGGTRMDRLRDNLQSAWNASDQYVWIYGEQNRWWNLPANDPKVKRWNEALPGLDDLLWEIKDPEIAATKVYESIQKDKNAVNLLKNSDFSQGKVNQTPTYWWSWQIEDKKPGTLLWDEANGGTALGKNVSNGCFGQDIPIEGGKLFYFQCKVNSNRLESVSACIRWRDADDKWTQEINDVLFGVKQDKEQRDRGIIEGLIRVPKGAAKLIVLLSLLGQNKDDFGRFDDVKLYKVQ